MSLHELKIIDYNMLKWYYSFRATGTCENVILDSYIWKDYYETKYFYNDKGLIWIMNNRKEVFSITPLCKIEDIKQCFSDAQNYFNNELGIKLKMYLVDEEAVQALDLNEEEFTVAEERDYFDYIYDAEKLRTLSGKPYHKKKNHVNAFYKGYNGEWEYKELGNDNREEIYEFLDIWNKERNILDTGGYNTIGYELEGIKYILENRDKIPSYIGGIYINGKLEAFSIGSFIKAEETAYIHIEKANPNIRGLYNAINQQFLINAFPNAKYVNREDDMGLEGLRKAKMSYRPVNLLKKYTIVQK